MASEYKQSSYRGLLVPDRRITAQTIDAGSSTYNQAGATVGVPAPQNDTDLNLRASGSQNVDGNLRIATQRGGFGGDGRASFRWQNEGDSSWRGWDSPSTLSGWRSLVWTDGSPAPFTGITATYSPHAITTSGGVALTVFHAAAGLLSDSVYIGKLKPDGSKTLASVTAIFGGGLTAGLHPSIVELPSGRLLCYYYNEDLTTKTLQIAVNFSDDMGSTWSLLSASVLETAINIDPTAADGFNANAWPSRGLRVAYGGGQLLMLIGLRSNLLTNWQDYFHQYASDDGGANFALVEDWGSTAGVRGIRPSIVAVDSGFEVFYIAASIGGIKQSSIGSAFERVTQGTIKDPLNGFEALGSPIIVATESGTIFTDGDLAVALSDSGEGYLTFRAMLSAFGVLDEIVIAYNRWGWSTPRTATPMGQSAVASNIGHLWNGEGGGDYPRDLALTGIGGGLVLCHNWIATTGNEDNSLGAFYLGGYSDLTLPVYQENGYQRSRMQWSITWIPIELPQDMPNWSHATGAASAEILSDGAVNLQTTGSNNSYYRIPTGSISEGIAASFAVEYVSASLLFGGIRALFKLETTAASYGLRVSIKSGAVQAYDTKAAVDVGNLAITTSGVGVEIRVFMNAGKATVYARSRDYKSDRVWSLVCNGATLSNGGAGVSSEIRWGHDIGSTAESNWFWFAYCSDEWACQVPAASGYTNPADLFGRSYGADPVFVDGGVNIAAIDGPTGAGDSWNIDTRYNYAIGHVSPLAAPSPSKRWRSTDETAQTIIWDLGGPIPSGVLGLHLEGVNWRLGSLSGWNASTAAWDSLATIDTATGQTGIAVALVGDTYTQSAAVVPLRWVDLGELVGGVVEIGGVTREVVANTQGTIAGKLAPMARIALSGGEPANGFAHIWSPRITVVMQGLQPVYTKIRLVIDANQNTPRGYYEIGQMVCGPIHVFTRDYSWGRIQESTPNTELVTYRDGSRSSFKRGESRRSASFGWVDGIDTTALNGANPDPDYVMTTTTAGAVAVGYRGDLPSVLSALSEDLGGSDVPLVYLPAFDQGPPDTLHLQGKSAALYGRMIGGIARDTLVGDELDTTAGEVVAVSQITIEGEL